MVAQLVNKETKNPLHGIFLELEQIEMNTGAIKSLAMIGEMAQNSGLSDLDYTAQFDAIYSRADAIYKSFKKIHSGVDEAHDLIENNKEQ